MRSPVGQIGSLLLHRDAAIIGQHERGDVESVPFGVFARDLARLVVPGPTGEALTGLDPHEPLAGIAESEARRRLPAPSR